MAYATATTLGSISSNSTGFRNARFNPFEGVGNAEFALKTRSLEVDPLNVLNRSGIDISSSDIKLRAPIRDRPRGESEIQKGKLEGERKGIGLASARDVISAAVDLSNDRR